MGKCHSACSNACGSDRDSSAVKNVQHETPPKDPKEEAIDALLDHYRLGAILGEGAFGVVSLCYEISTGDEFAVKMVDKVETPLTDIKREAELLRKMNHRNVVKCFGVFDDKCFVCIVMNKLDGGDIVFALEAMRCRL
eukprot:Skav208999  [mRNA]  locus=scaffold2686:193697:199246:- [translate_table: standard]